jgi:threonyl-tRNA synthetase
LQRGSTSIGSKWTSATRRSASASANAEVEKIPVVIVYGDKESDDALAVRERGGEQSTRSLEDSAPYLATL